MEAYQTGSSTPITSGITLTVDYSGVTGLNHVSIVASGGNGFATAKDVSVVIAAGTVDSVSVVGETIASFSIENRSALMPTTGGRTLDVSAGGEAGVDWANVGSPTTALNLSGTTIATTQKVDVDTIKTNPVVNGGTITFPTNATLASTTNITGGTITTVTTTTTATSVTNPVTVGTNNDKTGYALSATGSAAMTEDYAADGAAFTLNQGLYMIWSLLAERAISGTTLTASKLDGTTPAMTFTLDDATTPNSQTRAT